MVLHWTSIVKIEYVLVGIYRENRESWGESIVKIDGSGWNFNFAPSARLNDVILVRTIGLNYLAYQFI